MATRYGWRPGSHIRIDADKAGRELEDIRRRNAGCLTPADVVERARSANSSLHEHFEWDDAKAAEAHRVTQAGELIRAIVVDVTHSNIEPPKRVRAFVSVEREGERSYTSVAHALSDAQLRNQLLQQAWAELAAIRKKYGDLQELALVFQAMDRSRPAVA